ncbi:S66 peptidase family protein [Puia dinghuensis]|uniref:Peptidase S66 n=1 Tax=Puia dinghuensis TaxID=1792502 RepID=A0A8J2UEM2_9BACT|nr:LD-carboxypeptidase [Puia dinghuensis]GGB05714.1 peptidase S66 [Puia dinghuensis]
MIILPPFLRPDDTIAIVCPAGYMAPEKAQTCIDTLQTWGYRVRIGKTLGGPSDNYFSGTDDQRLADLQQMLDDDDVKAILCGRGGYGLSRIIDRIDLTRFVQAPKWIIGFSDITVLHLHIFSNYRIATLHAPMAGAFNDGGAAAPGVESLRRVLAGERPVYQSPVHPFNRPGRATGRLIGGNLALLAHLIGSDSEPDTDGSILFLEDIGEYLYNIDRMLYQLRRSGKLRNLAGLLIGGFTEMKDTIRPFGATVSAIVRDAIGDAACPVAFDFPVSHGGDNVALKIGATYSLEVASDHATLLEIPPQQ